MTMLDAGKLVEFISAGETQTLDLRATLPAPVELAARLCGLANAQGGLLVLGVDAETRQATGITDTDETILALHYALSNIEPVPLIDPPEPEIYLLDGKAVVVVTVLPATRAVCQTAGVCWMRHEAETYPLSVQEIAKLAGERGIVHWEMEPTPDASMKDIDVERLLEFLRERAGGEVPRDKLAEAILGIKCAVVRGRELRPTNAGILFFGKEPQRFILQSELVCAAFQGQDSQTGPVERQVIRGRLPELIRQAEAFVEKFRTGEAQTGLPEIPFRAVREGLVNAVLHRDYSREGENVRLYLYPDRVEIHSPGLLLPGTGLEQVVRGEAPARYRNPVLANLLNALPGYTQGLGNGIGVIIEVMQRQGLPSPSFRQNGEFVVTFNRTAPAQEKQPAPPQRRKRQPRTDREKSPAIYDPEKRLILAIHHAREQGYITNKQLCQLTGVTEQTAIRDLETLVERGDFRRVGKTRARRYLPV